MSSGHQDLMPGGIPSAVGFPHLGMKSGWTQGPTRLWDVNLEVMKKHRITPAAAVIPALGTWGTNGGRSGLGQGQGLGGMPHPLTTHLLLLEAREVPVVVEPHLFPFPVLHEGGSCGETKARRVTCTG